MPKPEGPTDEDLARFGARADKVLAAWMADPDETATERLLEDMTSMPVVDEWQVDVMIDQAKLTWVEVVTGEWRVSKRQIEVLQHFVDGKRFAEMAALMGVTEGTASDHLRRAKLRLRARTNEQAVAIALCAGLVHMRERDPEQGKRLYSSGLSKREKEVLLGIADGYSNEEIAERLGISHETVKNHVASMILTMGAKNRAHAVRLGFTTGRLRYVDVG